MTGTHAPTRRPWSRRRRIALVAGVLLVLVAAVAIALSLLRAEIEGALDVPATDPADVEFFGSISLDAGSTAGCEASTAGGSLMLDMTGSPGEFCELSAAVRLVDGEQSNRPWLVQGLAYNDQVDAGFTSNGTPLACGREIPPGTGGIPVRMKFVVGDDVVGGTSYPASETAGLIIVPEQEYIDADCPRG